MKVLCEAICWVANRLPDQHAVLEGDAQGIFTLFERHDDYAYHHQLYLIDMQIDSLVSM